MQWSAVEWRGGADSEALICLFVGFFVCVGGGENAGSFVRACVYDAGYWILVTGYWI